MIPTMGTKGKAVIWNEEGMGRTAHDTWPPRLTGFLAASGYAAAHVRWKGVGIDE